MNSSSTHKRPWAYYSLMLVAGCALVVGWGGRLYNLRFPPLLMWDEIYFPVFARNYLYGVPFFDLHPPLGKFILAGSIAILGDTPLGWRLMPALFGCTLVGLGAALGWYYFRDRVGALLLAAFIASETILIAYSRAGLLDGILIFFILATMLAAVRAERKNQVIWSARLLGLTISIKWAAFGVAVPVGYVLWRKGMFRHFLPGLYVSAVIYVLIVLAGQVVNGTGGGMVFGDANAWVKVWEWHLQALNNISNAVYTSDTSSWWSWPLMLRPILFYYYMNPAGEELTVWAIGNPVIWWSSTLAVVVGLLELARRAILRKPLVDHPLVPILLGYVVLLLPWVPTSRVPYLYNYLPSYAFALLALVYWLCRLWRLRPWGPWAVVAFAACAVATALYFLPMVTGLPISHESLRQRVWLETWDRIQFNFQRSS